MTDPDPGRRRVLALGGAALLGGLAGCESGVRPGGVEAEGGSAGATGQGDSATAYTRVYRETIESVVLVRTGASQGSGFVVRDGYVVTNAHVVGSAAAADVRFRDGRWRDGEVVGTDPHTDLAVVAVEGVPESATPLPFSETPATVGQEVVAIGNPFDLNGTVTAGIVSGTDRLIPAPTGFSIPDAIQTDAAVNPGNSGGPLMSLESRVLAVINSGGGDNIAFGISAAMARRVVPALIETGDYDHSFVGVALADVTPAIAEANGIDEPRGLLVLEVFDGGPADGVLQPSTDEAVVDGTAVDVGGDVLLAVDGTDLATLEDLGSYLALETRPGQTVEFRVLRDGTERTVELELGTRPTEP